MNKPAVAPTIVPAKVGLFGGTGSGKTTTAALLAIGISLKFHNGAPVYVYDTEPGWQFMRRPFITEGIELIQTRQRSFVGMRESLVDAQKRGACVFVTDSMTHIWQDLMQTFANKWGKVEFQSFNLIKKHWSDWTVEFLNSPLHCFALGRLGYEYETETNEKGKKEIVKGDSKFKAGGGESFGYEPHLLVEMELERDNTHNGRGGTLVHTANVLKDRTRVLNGETFSFNDLKGYKKGDYAEVFNAFWPHIEEVQLTEGLSVIADSNSDSLLPEHDGSYSRAKADREVALENIEASMTLLWPGQDRDSKSLKIKVLEQVFGSRSWKEISERIYTDKLLFGVAILRRYETKAKEEHPSTEDAVLNLLDVCRKALDDEQAEQVF